jgi:ankyrin repeat protein
VKDLRLRYNVNAMDDDRFEFELLVNRGRNRPRLVLLLTCDSESCWKQVIEDLENVILAYHRQTDIVKMVGWFHDMIQGNIFSAAYMGDIAELRKHIKQLADVKSQQQSSQYQYDNTLLDEPDLTGMTALHWASLRGHEGCVRLLLDKGADVDILQKGMNSPLLLAAAGGHETVARLLLERGADISLRNVKGHDAVFMSVLYGHATKGLPWLLQLLTHRGVDLNQVDSCGATPLHLCAEKNLARPVRMLVDAGADVNAKHSVSQWSPLQLACKHRTPDVETIRSFLDKGAYPNWKDLQGKTAFGIALSMQPSSSTSVNSNNNGNSNTNYGKSLYSDSIDEIPSTPNNNSGSYQSDTQAVPPSPGDKWRVMDETLSQVGDWAVRALPALLELCRKGARFELRELEFLRASFRSAVQEARDVWLNKSAPTNFREFVFAREQAGEDLLLHKGVWHKDKASSVCPLCSDSFGLTNRRHHCRACGILCCDKCSSKRMQLSDPSDSASSGNSNANNSGSTSNSTTTSGMINKEERVCDGCFNRLSHEASQPSPDHFRVRQLKQCALDAIQSIEELIEALDDPHGESHQLQHQNGHNKMASFSSAMATTNSSFRSGSFLQSSSSFRLPQSKRPSSLVPFDGTGSSSNPTAGTMSPATTASIRTGDLLIDALKLREQKLYRAEDIVAKFLEAADGYHGVSKKLIEQKTESKRLWGSSGNTTPNT